MRFAAFVMTYHRPRELALTLETLLEQSLRPESIVVVDNGSSRETEDVVASLTGARYLDAGGNLVASFAQESMIRPIPQESS